MIKSGISALIFLICATPAAAAGHASLGVGATSAAQVADEILAADRAFSLGAANVDTVRALAAMFHEDVVMPLPGGNFARGKSAAVEALRANPFNSTSKAEWAPLRAGVSADGQHGFSFGYMTLRGNDGTTRLAKYLTYWVRTAEGWRAAAYKRMPRPEGEISLALMEPSLPRRLVAPRADRATIAAHRQSLMIAERAFSDQAQRMGIGPAFRENGRDDSVNGGSAASFAVGAQAISEQVGDGATSSPVHWGADDALVASSGDLGVTFGVIRPNGPPPEGSPAASSFFTIWRREAPGDRWRYIAE